MIAPRFSILAFASVAFAASLLADTVTLKDGKKLEGKITNETETQITIETKSGGIIDEQTVDKASVQSVSKTTPDEAAYASLRTIKLGANSLPTPTQYDNFLAAMKSFLAQHPTSKYKAEIEKLVADFEAEQKRVSDGEVKLDGKWLGKAEVQRERYQISGAVAANYMKEQSARGDQAGAMNTFEVLEKQYPGSGGFIDGVEAARRIAAALKQQADARLARLPVETAEREKSIAGAAGLNKIELQGEFDREKQSIEAALAQAKRQGAKWPPFIPRSEESMKQISNLASEVTSRLSSIDVAKARQSLQFANDARAALDKKDLTAAEEKVRAAREAWGANELVTRLETEISETRAAAAAKEAAAAAAAEAQSETKPEMKAEEKATDATETTDASANTPEEPAAEEESNPIFRLMLIIVLAIVAFVGLKAYRNVRKKASEVIE
jgi:hypothetical protein